MYLTKNGLVASNVSSNSLMEDRYCEQTVCVKGLFDVRRIDLEWAVGEDKGDAAGEEEEEEKGMPPAKGADGVEWVD